MHNRPQIQTAIPRRRYQIGDFGATLLADIESSETRAFRFIMAFVAIGQQHPVLYVCAEEVDLAAESDLGHVRLRVVSEVLDEVLGTGDGWADVEVFAEQALAIGAQILGLQGESIVRLL